METNILDNELQHEQIDIDEIQYAGFWIRFLASIIDSFALIPITLLNLYNLYFLKNIPLELFITLIAIVYKPFMEAKYGATLGKMALKIKVLNSDNKSIEIKHALLRYIPWVVGIFISLYSSYILFNNPDFLITKGWTESSLIQAELIPKWLTYINSFTMIIFGVFIAFTTKKQGLHDFIANTVVVKK